MQFGKDAPFCCKQGLPASSRFNAIETYRDVRLWPEAGERAVTGRACDWSRLAERTVILQESHPFAQGLQFSAQLLNLQAPFRSR